MIKTPLDSHPADSAPILVVELAAAVRHGLWLAGLIFGRPTISNGQNGEANHSLCVGGLPAFPRPRVLEADRTNGSTWHGVLKMPRRAANRPGAIHQWQNATRGKSHSQNSAAAATGSWFRHGSRVSALSCGVRRVWVDVSDGDSDSDSDKRRYEHSMKLHNVVEATAAESCGGGCRAAGG